MSAGLNHKQDSARHSLRVGVLIAVFSAALGLGIAYILLMTQPELSGSARDMIGQRVGPDFAHWLVPVAIAGIAMGAAGLGVSLLSGLVRGVRQQPFLLLAPMLCVVTVSVLVSMPAEPQLGIMGARGFAVPALLLALGGATLFQLDAWLAKLAGLVVWLAPALLLVGGGLSNHPTFAADVLLVQAGHPLAMLVGFCWAGLGLLAWVAPDVRDAVPLSEARAAVRSLRTKLLDAERRITLVASQGPDGHAVSHLQARLAQAERELQQVDHLRWTLHHARERADRMEADALAGGRAPGLLWSIGLGLGAVMVTAAVGYVGWLRPLHAEVRVAASSAAVAVAPGVAELQEERTQFKTALADHKKEAEAQMAAALRRSSDQNSAHEATIAALRSKLGAVSVPPKNTEPASVGGVVPVTPVKPQVAKSQVAKSQVAKSQHAKSAASGVSKKAVVRRTKVRRAKKKAELPAVAAKSALSGRATKSASEHEAYKELLKAPAKKVRSKKALRGDLAEFLDDDPIGGL